MDILLFFILLVASAFFSSSETAFLSLDNMRLKQLEGRDNKAARRVLGLLAEPHDLLVTILIGNTLVNIAASSVLAQIFYVSFGEKGIIYSIIVMTLMVLVFGEVTPKRFALSHPGKLSLFSSLPLKCIKVIFSPITFVLNKISRGIVRALGVDISEESPRITEQEIRSLFSIGKKRGVVKEKEKDMIESILEFKELNAADIMTPRIDMVSVDLNMDKNDVVKKIKDSQYSRLPIFVHTVDNIVGILHSKDFLLDPTVPVRQIIRHPVFVPESMRIDGLLRELQRRQTHIAVVADEYGVTSGVVTFEDILEEIVGEIRDELDYESPSIRKVDQKSFEVDGQTHIDEVNEQIGLSIDTDEVDTIGGYVVLLMGRIPQAGEKIEIGGFLFTVEDVSKNRITILKVDRLNGK